MEYLEYFHSRLLVLSIFLSYCLLFAVGLSSSKEITTAGTHEYLCSFRPNRNSQQLEKYNNVDAMGTTVSGISNGGAFAVHISFIYSSLIHGAGIFAATPYPMFDLLTKWNPRAFHNSEYYPVIDDLSDRDLIDSTTNLKGFKAFVYMGLKDTMIHRAIVKNVASQFEHYGADLKNMTFKISAGHCFPTDNPVNDEPKLGRLQGICNVGYQGVADMFSHFFGSKFVQPGNSSVVPTGTLFKADISEFYPGCNPEINSINPTAWVYIPKWCTPKSKPTNKQTQCKLHFAFHGYALPYRARILGNSINAFVQTAGYLQSADSNNVILIFPEARWRGYDVIGYTHRQQYLWKTGIQNLAIKRMIDRVIRGE